MIVKPGQIYRGLRKSGYVHYIVDSITPSGTEIWMRNITNFKPNRTKHRFCSGLSQDDLIANSLEEYKEKFMPKKHENPVTKATALNNEVIALKLENARLKEMMKDNIDALKLENERLLQLLDVSERRAFALMFLVNGNTTLETVRHIFDDVLTIFRINYDHIFNYDINPIVGVTFVAAKTQKDAKNLFDKKVNDSSNIKFKSIERVGYASKEFKEEGFL